MDEQTRTSFVEEHLRWSIASTLLALVVCGIVVGGVVGLVAARVLMMLIGHAAG